MSDCGFKPRNWLGEISKETLSDAERAELGLPRTFRVVADPGAAQQLLFEPATKHFDRSFRASEPRFSDAEQATAWLQARRTAVITALTAVSGS